MKDKATDYLDAHPVKDDDFTTDKDEAIRRGIYWRPVCECGCGEASRYILGARRNGREQHYIATWDCRNRLRTQGVTKNTSMHGFVGVRFVTIDRKTGKIL